MTVCLSDMIDRSASVLALALCLCKVWAARADAAAKFENLIVTANPSLLISLTRSSESVNGTCLNGVNSGWHCRCDSWVRTRNNASVEYLSEAAQTK